MTVFRRHDRYVLRAFWGALLAALLFFGVIVVLIHLADWGPRLFANSERLRADGHVPILLVFEFYGTMLPFLSIQLVPLATVLAAAFGLSRLSRHNELDPLVAAGVTTRRITLPIVVSGIFIAAFLTTLQETVVPGASRRHINLLSILTDREPDRVVKVPHFDDPGGARLSMAALQPAARRIEEALLTFRDDEGHARELRFYPLLEWEEATARWIAIRGGRRFALDRDRTGRDRETLPTGDVAPLEANARLVEVSVMKDLALGISAGETATLLEADPEQPRLILLYHRTLAQSLGPLVLLLVSLPFCMRLGRSGALSGLLAVLVGAAALYSLSFLTSRLAASGELNPVVLAWLPTVFVGSIGLSLWLSMRS